MRALTALILSDGRPGHYNLAKGIVAALARQGPVAIMWQDVTRRRLLPSRALAGLIAAGVGPGALLKIGYGLSARHLPPADVVVSAGGNTLAANIAAARHLRAPNLFYGSLRAYPAAAFALVLTSYADQVRSPHPVMTLKPSALDPDAIRAPGGSPRRTTAVLIGGDGSGVAWKEADWNALLALLERLPDIRRGSVVITNSRRTPDAVSDRLAALTRTGQDIAFVDVRQDGMGTLAALLADADDVLVTADSSSMLSEAIWARRPTLSLAPSVAALPVREAAYRAHLEQSGGCRRLPLAGLTPETIVLALEALTPLADNPLDTLAGLIVRHVPSLAR